MVNKFCMMSAMMTVIMILTLEDLVPGALAVLGGILYLFLSCPVGHPALCGLHLGL